MQMTKRQRKAEKAERALLRDAFVKQRTYVDDRGLRRCKAHGKVYYGSAAKAHAGLVEYTRHPQSDPGAVTYGCQFTRGWHIGHPGGWKSLGRLMDEADGVTRMEPAS